MTTACEEAEKRYPYHSEVGAFNAVMNDINVARQTAFVLGAEWQAKQPRRAGDSVAAAIGHRILGGENPIEVARDYDIVPYVEITDEMVERGARAAYEWWAENSTSARLGDGTPAEWDDLDRDDRAPIIAQSRAVLEVALGEGRS